MSKLSDDLLMKVNGGTNEKSFGEMFSDVIWGAVADALLPILDSLKVDSTFGVHAGCILQVIQNRGMGTYDPSVVITACKTLMTTKEIQADPTAKECLQAIEGLAEELKK